MKAKEILKEAMGNKVKVPVAVMIFPDPDEDGTFYEFSMDIGRKDLAIALGYLLSNGSMGSSMLGMTINSSDSAAEVMGIYRNAFNKKVNALEKKVLARYKNNQL